MKPLFRTALLAFLFLTLSYSSCKKNKPDPDCGCNSSNYQYTLQNINGSLSFFQYKSKWVLSYQPLPGNVSNYFPCNTSQDSLQAILQGANQNQIFQVRFSGKIKSSCPGEDFGITSGVATFDYIILDSLKRN